MLHFVKEVGGREIRGRAAIYSESESIQRTATTQHSAWLSLSKVSIAELRS